MENSLLFLFALMLHNLEEGLWMPEWMRRNPRYAKTTDRNAFWFALVALTALALLLVFGQAMFPDIQLFDYLILGYAGAMALNALIPHILTTVATRSYSPGLLTGLLLNVPVAVGLIGSELARGQAEWHWVAMAIIGMAGFLLASLRGLFSLGSRLLDYVRETPASGYEKIDHVALRTSDLESMRSFYCRYFGSVAGERYCNAQRNYQSYFLRFSSGTRIELFQEADVTQQRVNQTNTGLHHVAIGLGTRMAVDLITGQLEKDGYKVLSYPRLTGDGYYESVVCDPENNRLELTA